MDDFAKTLKLFVNPWSDETELIENRLDILVEEFAYMAAVQAAASKGLQIVSVAMDHKGMRSEGPGDCSASSVIGTTAWARGRI